MQLRKLNNIARTADHMTYSRTLRDVLHVNTISQNNNQSGATHCLGINGNEIYNTLVTFVYICIIDTMEVLNTVILSMLVQFPTVAIPVSAYMYK